MLNLSYAKPLSLNT